MIQNPENVRYGDLLTFTLKIP